MEEVRGVERYEPVRSCLPEVGNGVPAHRHQQRGVSKHHDAGGPASHRYPKPSYPPQTSVLPLIRKILCKHKERGLTNGYERIFRTRSI